MVQAAESAVHHYKDDRKEFEERTKAIRSLKDMFTAKQNTHIKNLQEYEHLIIKEMEIGKKMKEVGKNDKPINIK